MNTREKGKAGKPLGTWLQCYHKGCGHRWNYTGKAEKWICCSGCRSPLSIRKLKEKGFWGVK